MKADEHTTLIVADLGNLRAFRVKKRGIDESMIALEEIKLPKGDTKPKPIGEVTSDQAGRFPRGGGSGMSNGEEHEVAREMKDRAIGSLAQRIDDIIGSEKSRSWKLAAPQVIADRLVGEVAPENRKKLVQTEHADLTKFPLKKIEQRLA